jgi:hypothetical protein
LQRTVWCQPPWLRIGPKTPQKGGDGILPSPRGCAIVDHVNKLVV